MAREAAMAFSKTQDPYLAHRGAGGVGGGAGSIPGLCLRGERNNLPTDSREWTKAGSTGLGARCGLTFQGQAGIPWESQAEDIIMGKDLRDSSTLFCSLHAV